MRTASRSVYDDIMTSYQDRGINIDDTTLDNRCGICRMIRPMSCGCLIISSVGYGELCSRQRLKMVSVKAYTRLAAAVAYTLGRTKPAISWLQILPSTSSKNSIYFQGVLVVTHALDGIQS